METMTLTELTPTFGLGSIWAEPQLSVESNM
jgi:hypothetical protein